MCIKTLFINFSFVFIDFFKTLRDGYGIKHLTLRKLGWTCCFKGTLTIYFLCFLCGYDLWNFTHLLYEFDL